MYTEWIRLLGIGGSSWGITTAMDFLWGVPPSPRRARSATRLRDGRWLPRPSGTNTARLALGVWASGRRNIRARPPLANSRSRPTLLENGPTSAARRTRISTYIPEDTGTLSDARDPNALLAGQGIGRPVNGGLPKSGPTAILLDDPAATAYAGWIWDLPLDDRGMLFAPALFPDGALWDGCGWFYQRASSSAFGEFFKNVSGSTGPGYKSFLLRELLRQQLRGLGLLGYVVGSVP